MANTDWIVLLTAKLVQGAKDTIQGQLDKWKFSIKLDDVQLSDEIKKKIQNKINGYNDLKIKVSDVSFENDFSQKLQEQLNKFNGLKINIDSSRLDQKAVRQIQSQLDQHSFNININGGNIPNLPNNPPQNNNQNNSPIPPSRPNKPKGNSGTSIAPGTLVDAWKDVTSPKIEVDYEVREGASEDLNAEIKREIERIQQSNATVVSVRYTTRSENAPVEDPNTGEIYLDKVEHITGATLKYTTAAGEAITKTLKWGQILDETGKSVVFEGWTDEVTAYTNEVQQATEKTDAFVKKQKQTVANFTNTLNQISANALDPNASKSITSDSSVLSLKTQIGYVENALFDLRNANSSTFDDAKLKVEEEISSLKILIGELKRAENIQTKLKSDKLTINAEGLQSDFDGFEAKLKNVNVSSEKLAQNVAIVKQTLDRKNKGEILNKADLEAANDALSIAKKELTSLINIKTTDSALEKVKLDAQTIVNELDEMSKKNPTFDSWEHELNGVTVTVANLKQELASITNAADLTVAKAKINEFKSAFKSSVETAKVSANDLKKAQDGLANGSFDAQYKKLADKAASYVNENGKAIVSVESLKNALDNIKVAQKDGDNSALITNARLFAEEYKKVDNQIKSTTTSLNKVVSEQQRLAKANIIEAWNQKNSRATAEVKQKNEEYIKSLRDLNTQMSRMKFNEINNGFKESENSMRAINRLGASFSAQIKQAAESFGQWISVSGAIMFAVDKTKDAVRELKEVDNILTEISKTSDLTKDQLKDLGKTSFDEASKLGKKASDYLTGVTEMSRSGFYGEQGKSMAQQSLLAQSAGDMSAEIANKYIIATNAAYKFNGQAEKLNQVLDGQNSISNKNSIALEDFALAMSEAGTVAANYRVSIEDLSAMTGVIEAVTKSGGTEVGNSIKSILINLQNINSSKIVNTLDRANASMTEFVDGTEQLRDPISILRDLAKTFNSLDEADPLRAEILTNVAGKYQAPKLSALLSNIELFDKMLADYDAGAGSALEEANKSANNLTGALNRLGNTWTKIVNNVIDSDGLTSAVDVFNDLLNVVVELSDTLGASGFLGLTAGSLLTKKGLGKIIVFNASFCKVI